MRLACSMLVLTSGCHELFSIDTVDGPSPTGDVCDPIPYDADRYWAPEGRLLGLRWGFGYAGARTDCATRAMDLAVFNIGDDAELDAQIAGASAPFWLGILYGTDWSAIDGCAPRLSWAPGQPTSAQGQCVVIGTAGMVETRPCSHDISEEGEHIQALCETPRPSQDCRAGAARSSYKVATMTPVTEPVAVEMCATEGMHVVEINSSAERDQMRTQFPLVTRYWLDAQFDGEEWKSSNECPLVFAWQAGEPDLSRSCALMQPFGARTMGCDQDAAVICEKNT